MELSFTPTKKAGGVLIKGDATTLSKVERLLTRTAIESHACADDGFCMILSRYFERNREVVDWVTLVAGVCTLRNSMGYRLSRENHALICLLEHLTYEALCALLPKSAEQIDTLLTSLYSLNDFSFKGSLESRVVYLHLLKTARSRKAELLDVLSSLNMTLSWPDLGRDYCERFEGLRYGQLSYGPGEKFQYPL